jgi:ABC-type polysaccharide/polyol phosphate export permease
MSALTDLRELIDRRAVIGQFVAAELRSGHRDKLLGNLWQLIDPLALMLVYYVVWSLVLGRRPPDFMAYILSGIITFQMFQGSVIGSSGILRGQARLIREVYFPKASLPTAIAIARLYDFIWALFALGMVLIWLLYKQAHWVPGPGMPPIKHPLAFGWNALWLPAAAALLFTFSLGFSYVFAVAGALFRDTPNILQFVFRMWFYLSPMFYYGDEKTVLRHRLFHLFYRVNPFTHLFRMVRNSLIYDRPPTLDGTVYVAAVALGTLVFGFWLFSRCESAVVKQL